MRSYDLSRRHECVAAKHSADARIVAAMKVHNVTHLLTFNTDDFKRYDEITVVNPQNIA